MRGLLFGLALIATPLAAQEAKAPTPYDRAIAAGYKALTLCSAIFNAEALNEKRTVESVETNELKGIYPEVDPLISSMTAKIERIGLQGDSVSVDFDPSLPPRLAISGDDAGCRLMPIGMTRSQAPKFGYFTTYEATDRRGWPAQDPVRMVAARGLLRTVGDRAFVSDYGAQVNTTAIVVLRDGRIVGETYKAGFGPGIPQRTWSVAKSLAGTLVGAVVQAGMVRTDAPISIPEWRASSPDHEGKTVPDPRSAITLDNLLRMASGLHSATAGNRTDAVYFGGTAVTEETVAWPLEAKPGTRFRYANNDILLAVHAIQSLDWRNQNMEQQKGTIADLMLFKRIDMDRTIAETDWRGNYILSSQVWSTARDLARFGQLYLQDGVWNGQRILPEGWVKYVTTPSGPQPDGEFGYGATFWLMNKSPGVPADTFAAFGNRGQYVVIVPSRQVVIVRRGEDPAGARFDIAKFAADVLTALK